MKNLGSLTPGNKNPKIFKSYLLLTKEVVPDETVRNCYLDDLIKELALFIDPRVGSCPVSWEKYFHQVFLTKYFG